MRRTTPAGDASIVTVVPVVPESEGPTETGKSAESSGASRHPSSSPTAPGGPE